MKQYRVKTAMIERRQLKSNPRNLSRPSSRRRRLQWPLLRAVAAGLVYLATATGAAAASTTPTPTRLRLHGNEQRGEPGGGGGGTDGSRGGDSGGGSRCHPDRLHRSAIEAGGWTERRRTSTRCSSGGDGQNCHGSSWRPNLGRAVAGAEFRRGSDRVGLAFLQGVTGARIKREGRQQHQHQRQPSWCPRQLGTAAAATAAWSGSVQQQHHHQQGRWRSRPRRKAVGAALAFKGEGESISAGGRAGAAAKSPLRRRPRQSAGVNSGDWRSSLYMREGAFQALPHPVRITVMGGGNFGLALSLVLARNEIPTTLLVRTDSVAEHVNKNNEHPNYLKGITLPQHIVATSDPKEALADPTFIIHAVPVQYTRKFLENVVEHMPAGTPILSVSKGIETSSLMLMNDILKDLCGTERSYAFLSGPSFAREIAMNQATAVVIASEDSCLANDMAKILSSPTFRCFTSKDVVGVEVGGAVKNVIALAAGMCEGLGLGTNAMAGLVTRGCGEMRRLAIILGGKSQTLSGLSGVGDTFGTCFGPLSRNRNFGIRLGKGESMEEILASSTEVAEGVDTALALADLIRKTDKSYRIDLKYAIIFGVADILRGTRSPKEGLEDLMTMPLKAEMYDA